MITLPYWLSKCMSAKGYTSVRRRYHSFENPIKNNRTGGAWTFF